MKRAGQTSSSKRLEIISGRNRFPSPFVPHSRRTSGKSRCMTVTSATVDIGSEVGGFRQYRKPRERTNERAPLVADVDAKARLCFVFSLSLSFYLSLSPFFFFPRLSLSLPPLFLFCFLLPFSFFIRSSCLPKLDIHGTFPRGPL